MTTVDTPTATINPKDLAQQVCDAINAVHRAGLVMRTHNDHETVLSEPGHTIGWVDVALMEYDEEADEWTVTA